MARKLKFFQNILHFLEDPNHPSIGPNLRFLGLTGLWHPTKSPLSNFKQIVFYIIVAIFLNQYIKCLISFSSDSLKLILQYNPLHIGIVKACFFQKDHKLWEKLIAYSSALERSQLAKNDKYLDQIINSYVRRSHLVSYFFWAMAFFANFVIFLEPFYTNTNIFDSYTPFGKEPPGCYGTIFIQTIVAYIVNAYIVSWDTLVVSFMIFFAGQLKVARFYCIHVIKENTDPHQNIAEIHRYYTTLVKFQKMFNSMISAVMFVCLLITSVNFGMCIIRIAKQKDDLATLVSNCVYLIGCLIQLLMFYWHTNEITIESTLISYGIFESDWMMLDKGLQKEIALLGTSTQKKLVFKAGAFNEMSLSTFVAILRASYSFFTLLNDLTRSKENIEKLQDNS